MTNETTATEMGIGTCAELSQDEVMGTTTAPSRASVEDALATLQMAIEQAQDCVSAWKKATAAPKTEPKYE